MKKIIAVLLLAVVGYLLLSFHFGRSDVAVSAMEWVEVNDEVASAVGAVTEIKVYKIATTLTPPGEREKRVSMLVRGSLANAMITVGISSEKSDPYIIRISEIDSRGGSFFVGVAYMLIGVFFILSFYFGERCVFLKPLLYISRKTSLTGGPNMALVYGAIALVAGVGVILA